MRQMTLITSVYVVNYVIVLLLVHSPLSGGKENFAGELGNALKQAKGCKSILSGGNMTLDTGHRNNVALMCAHDVVDEVGAVYSAFVQSVVVKVSSLSWYQLSGLIPQVPYWYLVYGIWQVSLMVPALRPRPAGATYGISHR